MQVCLNANLLHECLAAGHFKCVSTGPWIRLDWSEMCCMWLTENTGRKKVAKNHHLGTIAQLCRAISSQLRHVSTSGKNFLSTNMWSTCSRNMVNFGPLTAEIGLTIWGIPANFNWFRVLAALLHVIW